MTSPYSRTRNKQLVRVLRLLALIGARRCSLDDLARELDVSTRTIRRDLEAIEAAYLPVTAVRGSDGVRRWRLVNFGGHAVTNVMSQAGTSSLSQ